MIAKSDRGAPTGKREVQAPAPRDSHVLAEGWCPLLRRKQYEMDRTTAPMADYCVALRASTFFTQSDPGPSIDTR
jgi:hypothetical protein